MSLPSFQSTPPLLSRAPALLLLLLSPLLLLPLARAASHVNNAASYSFPLSFAQRASLWSSHSPGASISHSSSQPPSSSSAHWSPQPSVWYGVHASAVWFDSLADDCFVAITDADGTPGPVQRVRLGSQPLVQQNYSLSVEYTSVFNVVATAQQVLVLAGLQDDSGDWTFSLTRKQRDTGDDAGDLQLGSALMADVAVWNATIPMQVMLLTPGNSAAQSVDPNSGELLAEWTGGRSDLNLQAAAFVPVNVSSLAAPHSVCVVLVHSSTERLQAQWQLLVVGCHNELVSNFSLDPNTDRLGSVRASADGSSVFVLSHVTADPDAADGSWYQFAQYDLRSGKLLAMERMWEYNVAPQMFFSLGRRATELLFVNALTANVQSIHLTTPTPDSRSARIGFVPTSSHVTLTRLSSLALLPPISAYPRASLVVADTLPNDIFVLDAVDGRLLVQLPTLDLMACYLRPGHARAFRQTLATDSAGRVLVPWCNSSLLVYTFDAGPLSHYTVSSVGLDASAFPLAAAEGPAGSLYYIDLLDLSSITQVDESSGQVVRQLDGPFDHTLILRLAYAPAAQTLYALDGGGYIYVYAAASGQLVDTWNFTEYNPQIAMLDIALSKPVNQSQQQLLVVTAVWSLDSCIMLWMDVSTKRQVANYSVPLSVCFEGLAVADDLSITYTAQVEDDSIVLLHSPKHNTDVHGTVAAD